MCVFSLGRDGKCTPCGDRQHRRASCTHTDTHTHTICNILWHYAGCLQQNKHTTQQKKKSIYISIVTCYNFSPPDLFSCCCCCCAALCTDQSHMENVLYKRVNAHIDPIQIRRDRLDRDFHNCAQSISL